MGRWTGCERSSPAAPAGWARRSRPARWVTTLRRNRPLYDHRAAQLPLGALPSPLDLANTAMFVCSDEASSFTGSILHPDDGMTSATGGG